MAAVLRRVQGAHSASSEKFETCFIPTAPPKIPRGGISYSSSLLRAPYIALGDHMAKEKETVEILKAPLSPRYRLRKQAGLTNRWQLPQKLDCDLLGTSQAFRAVRVCINDSLKRLVTADPPMFLNRARDEGRLSRQSTTASSVSNQPCLHRVQTPDKAQSAKRRFFGFSKPITSEELFCNSSRKVTRNMSPDVVLEYLGSLWELHQPYMINSATLWKLLKSALESSSKTYVADCTTEHMDKNNIDAIHNESLTLSTDLQSFTLPNEECSPRRKNKEMIRLKLNVHDPLITKEAFAIALCNLYSTERAVNEEFLVGVLATASLLQFPLLLQKCTSLMMNSISSSTVCNFHYVACKYKQKLLVTACERWLELNLVPRLRTQVYLRDLPLELLQKILKSSRLFTYSEYQLFRTVLYWVFLQLNPAVQILPSHITILTYFNSLPKRSAFLEREIGQKYMALIQSLRLQGITDCQQLDEIQQINFLPKTWLLWILKKHYHALQNGGDMQFLTDLATQAIRFGFVIEQEPRYCSEIISLYGFFFELKAIRHGESSVYSFYMQRLQSTDPSLSFRACERCPFSLRAVREVKYEIRAQSVVDGKLEAFSSGPLYHSFGITNKSRKSQVLKVDGLTLPIYVTFAILFPSS